MSYRTYLAATRRQAEKQAAESFKDHVLSSEGEGRWFFGRPGHSEFHFRVITAPGAVIMLGDTGEVILMPHGRDALGWLRGVFEHGPGKYDLGYIAEKVSSEMKTKEFEHGLIDQYIDDLERSANEDEEADRKAAAEEGVEYVESESTKSLRHAVEELRDHGEFDCAYEFHSFVRDIDGFQEDEFPDVEGLSFHFIHCIAGLYYFCEALTAKEEAERLISPPYDR